MSHALKIFLRILHIRIYGNCEKNMGNTQFGFKEGTGTREALFSIQVLVQNCRDVCKDIFMCFIDYEKAFDRVQHDKLMEVLARMDVEEKVMRCIKNLYWNQSAHVKSKDGITRNIEIKCGVRQGCILSPLLFNIYAEAIFSEALDSVEKGVKVNGTYINNIRYADDTTLIADNIEDLQYLIDKVVHSGKNFNLKINNSKTKFMIVSRTNNPYADASITIENNAIEKVSSFKYLGSWLTDDWTSDREVKCRIETARGCFNRMKKILNSRDLNINLRLRMVKCYVWSVLLYGCETWTLKVAHMNRIEAFEMWIYRRLLKISWVDHISNNEVLNRMRTDRKLLQTIKKRKAAYFGHILRGSKYQLLKLIVEGKIEGRRGIGRKQMSWLRNIRQWTGLRTANELIHLTANRDEYLNLINQIV